MKFEENIVINRPVEIVFKFLATDFANNLPKIQPDVVKIEPLSDEPIKTGSKFRLVTTLLTQKFEFSGSGTSNIKSEPMRQDLSQQSESTIEIIKYEPNKSFVYTDNNYFNYTASYSFNSRGPDTQVAIVVETVPPGIFLRLILPVLFKFSKKTNEKVLEDLKRVIETS